VIVTVETAGVDIARVDSDEAAFGDRPTAASFWPLGAEQQGAEAPGNPSQKSVTKSPLFATPILQNRLTPSPRMPS